MVLAAMGAFGGIVYAAFALFPLASGPSLSVSIATDEARGTALIAGNTARVSRLTINDLAVPLSERGWFSVERAFPLGYTVVVVRAEDRFGRKREERLTLITKEPNGYHASKEESDSKEGHESGGSLETEQRRLN